MLLSLSFLKLGEGYFWPGMTKWPASVDSPWGIIFPSLRLASENHVTVIAICPTESVILDSRKILGNGLKLSIHWGQERRVLLVPLPKAVVYVACVPGWVVRQTFVGHLLS